MAQILIFLVMLAGVTHAAETKCSSTQGTSVCCFAPGGSVYIQVITNASGHLVWCKKQLPSGLINVLSLKNQKLMIYEPFTNRTDFFINNGTFKMTNMEKNDSGQYIIEAFGPTGVFVRKLNIQLDVEEHASSSLIPTYAGVVLCTVLILILILVTVFCCVWNCQKKSSTGI